MKNGVITMFRKLYRKLIGEKLFTKVIIIYTIIIVLALVALTSVVLQNYTSSAHVSAINYSTQVVQDVNKYFTQKISYVKQVQQLPYLREELYGNILQLFDEEYDRYSSDYIYKKNALDQYFGYICDLDPTISEVHAYLIKTDSVYQYYPYNGSNTSELVTDLNMQIISKPAIKKLFSPMIVPTSQLSIDKDDLNNYSNITIAVNLRSKDLSKVVGTIFITFNLHELESTFSKNDKEFDFSLEIFDLDGTVLYDPSYISSNDTYPDFNELKNAQSDLIMEGNRITSIHINQDTGIVAACIIENSEVSASAEIAKKITIIIMTVCILVALVLSFICMSFFSKRIHAVCAAMKNIKAGNFKQRIKVGHSMDEISLIAANFNDMCDNLDSYMSEVYQAGMKQKDAEVKQKIAEQYALQSQINPHFLYNTLEAIRMSAVSSGNTEVAHMIYMLGSLFRNSINQQMFIGIRNEIDYCKSYLELLHLRYGERLKFIFTIDDSICRYGIIKHLLQPLVENSVIHGIDPDKSENLIQIIGRMQGNDIEILIEDNGFGIPDDKRKELMYRIEKNIVSENGSVGIVNVNQRIKLIYGDTYGLQINSITGNGTSIVVRIPAKTVKELEQYVQSDVS